MEEIFSVLQIIKEKVLQFTKTWIIGKVEVFFLICYIFLSPGPSFYSFDGFYYFAQLISIFEDFDLNIYNNLKKFPLPIQKRPNEWSIGPAVFWTPFYLIGHFFYYIHNEIGYFLFGWRPQYVDVFWFNICVVNFGTIFYTYLGLKLLGKSIKNYYNGKVSPLLIQATIFLCTPLLFYVFSRPLMAHAISFFMICVLVYIWVKWHDAMNSKQLLLTALILGLASIVRWQNVLFGVIFIPQIISTIKAMSNNNSYLTILKKCSMNLPLILIGFSIGFSPQLIAWQLQFGSPTPGAHDPSKFNIFEPQLRVVWFGQHGLFIWHPITLLFIIGFIFYLFYKDLRIRDGLVLIGAFLLQSYLWAIWYAPEAGCAFGMRGLIGTFPLLAFGYSNFLFLGKNKKLKYQIMVHSLFWGIFILFFSMNYYLFIILGHHFGTPILTCISKFNFEWFEEIDWELIQTALKYNLNFDNSYAKQRTLFVLVLSMLCVNTFQDLLKIPLEMSLLKKSVIRKGTFSPL